jgi:hypothetical protein
MRNSQSNTSEILLGRQVLPTGSYQRVGKVAILAGVFLLSACTHFTRVPAVRGQVLDAVTNEPVKNITVARHIITTSTWCNPPTPDRFSESMAGPDGVLKLSGFLFPLKHCSNFWGQHLYLNFREGGVRKYYGPGGHRSEFMSGVIGGRFDNQWWTNKRYFPSVVVFDPTRNAQQGFLLHRRSTKEITLPLIPVLDSPEDCAPVQNPEVRQACIDLNAYRLAVRNNQRDYCRKIADKLLREKCP